MVEARSLYSHIQALGTLRFPRCPLLFCRSYGSTSTEPDLSWLRFILFPPESTLFSISCLYLLWFFLRFFVSPPPSPIVYLAFRPWALVLRMMRRPCGCGCWLLVGVFRPTSITTSYVPRLYLPSTLLVALVPVPTPVFAPTPVLLSSPVLVLAPVPSPVPVPVTFSCLRPWCPVLPS